MRARPSCEELAEFRSAFVDGALADADRERLLRHLVGCAACRQEIEELRRVRRLLSQPRPAPSAPQDLASRLLSIPVGLDRHRRWRATRRRAGAAILSLGLALIAFVGIGYAAGPTPRTTVVADPTEEATAEYAAVLSQLPLASQAVGAVAEVPAAPLTVAPNPRPLPVDGPALGADQLRATLRRAAEASDKISYHGTETFVAVNGQQQVWARIEVASGAGQGVQLVTYDASGRRVETAFHPAASSGRIGDSAVLALLARSYSLSGWAGASVAGRRAGVVEARRPLTMTASVSISAPPVARLWLDQQTGVVLWRETYDKTGAITLSTGFTSFRLGGVSFLSHLPPAPVSRTTASLTVSRSGELSAAGWTCPTELVGLPLIRLRSDVAGNPTVVHLVYSDGLTTLSVLELRGRLAGAPADAQWDDSTKAYVSVGSPTVASWQSGETVFTMVGAGAPQVLTSAADALPHEALSSPSTMERVRAGWSRIVGKN